MYVPIYTANYKNLPKDHLIIISYLSIRYLSCKNQSSENSNKNVNYKYWKTLEMYTNSFTMSLF